MKSPKSRNITLDVIRCFALLLVVSLHYFYRNGFTTQALQSKTMLIAATIRGFCITCVPLFLMLSGYLCSHKQLSKHYYKGIIKTYIIYVFSSLAYMLYQLLFHGISFTFSSFILGTLDFSILPYCWYVEMYIGLFLLIPFLNLIYNNLKSKREKQVLLLTFLFMAAIPAVVNIYNFNLAGWWQTPAASNEYQQLLPNNWTQLGAVCYYFLGCYLKEYPLKIKKFTNTILLLFATITLGCFDYYRTTPYYHAAGLWQDNDSLFVVIIAVLIFNLLASINFDNIPNLLKHLLYHASNAVFGAYLLSCIFEDIVYEQLNFIVNDPRFTPRLKFLPVMVPIVYICSLALSGVLNLIYNAGTLLLKQILPQKQ